MESSISSYLCDHDPFGPCERLISPISAPPSPCPHHNALAGGGTGTKPSQPLLCSLPNSLCHSNKGIPTEVEVILNDIGYLPSVVKLVAKYRITTREDLLWRMKEEARKIKYELGMHKTPFKDSRFASLEKTRSSRHCNIPPASFIEFMKRSLLRWPQHGRPRKESIDEIIAELPKTWGEDAEEMEERIRAFLETYGQSPHPRGSMRRCSDSDKDKPKDTMLVEGTDLRKEINILEAPSKRLNELKDVEIEPVAVTESAHPSGATTLNQFSLRDKFLVQGQGDDKQPYDFNKSLLDIGDRMLQLPGRRRRLPCTTTLPALRKSTSMSA